MYLSLSSCIESSAKKKEGFCTLCLHALDCLVHAPIWAAQRCHPRLTLGWQRQEVLLSMPSDPLPTAEYVQAYCDLWRRGRHENVLVAPVEQDEPAGQLLHCALLARSAALE